MKENGTRVLERGLGANNTLLLLFPKTTMLVSACLVVVGNNEHGKFQKKPAYII
jgi:hypothetical protein